jgi:ABC-type nitrate/sulfonate/bicarbonate transport system ATPase subunit
MTPPRLELRQLSKAFGKLDVLAEVSLSARPGEFVSIVGPSGAGKSTLFKLLIGELEPDRGEALFDGAPLIENTSRFAFMPQRDALMPWRRVIDNLTLGLEVRGLSRRLARERVRSLLSEFGLEGFEQHFPAQLSGGMRQRAALLRTVVQDRDMLLLDEPLGALDALTRTGMQKWLETTWALHRWTAMLITHDVREAVFLSDRIYVLSARPARIVHEIDVPLPRPRSLGMPEAIAIETEILAILLNPDTGQRT